MAKRAGGIPNFASRITKLHGLARERHVASPVLLSVVPVVTPVFTPLRMHLAPKFHRLVRLGDGRRVHRWLVHRNRYVNVLDAKRRGLLPRGSHLLRTSQLLMISATAAELLLLDHLHRNCHARSGYSMSSGAGVSRDA